MIFEPTPTNPRSPVRRALGLAAIVLPVALFAGVLGAGLLGPKREPPAPAPSAVAAAPAITASTSPDAPGAPVAGTVADGSMPPASPGGPRSQGPAAAVEANAAGGDTAFPDAVANLRVSDVPGVLRARQEGRGQAVVAVAGYLRAWADPSQCRNPVPGLPGGGCERTAILAEVSWSSPGSEVFSGMGPHIHAVIPPGVIIPDTAVGPALTDVNPPPVVAIGHFAPGPSACSGVDPACEETFTIERVVWASGQDLALGRQVATPLVASGADPMTTDPALTTSRAIGPVTTLLRTVLVEPRELASVDALAAIAAKGARTHGPVWYVRGLDVPYDPLLDPPYGRRAAIIRWAVLSLRGKVIVSG